MRKAEHINEEACSAKAKNKKKKRIIWLWILLALIAIITAVAVALTVFVKSNFDYQYNEIAEEPEELGFEEIISEKITNIALFGVDSRQLNSFKGLSDSIMILSINENTKQVKLISVMRDSFVPITYNGKTNYSKINSAYSKGGPELAIKTLNIIFGLDISEYATVNFSGMADIIDAVGGIDVTLTENEISYLNEGILDQCTRLKIDPNQYYVSSAGAQHLNGLQAVSYSRIRYAANINGTTNDYGRTDRQRYVLGQLFNKAKNLDLETFIKLLKALAPCCETSVSYGEALDLGINVLLRSPTLEETRVPDTEYTMKAPTTSAGSVVYYDLVFAAKLIHGFIYDDIRPEDYIAQNGIEQNDWYISGFVPPIFNHDQNSSASSEISSVTESTQQ